MSRLDDYEFALCLTHDVDRPFKRLHQALYFALQERDSRHLLQILNRRNPFWQFESIMELEEDIGVRSAFYFLNEPGLHEMALREIFSLSTWIEKLGRYDVTTQEVTRAIRELDAGGWEVGLHGSYHTARDRERLREEKATLEGILGHPIAGGRQHHLRVETPETWRHYREIGLKYDTSLGSTTDYGFNDEYWVRYPFDDEFAVFPLTLMEQTLPTPDEHFDRAWEICESLLSEASENDAVMTVLFHPRLFAETEFPGYSRLYHHLVGTALDRGAWVGPPVEFYEKFLPSQQPTVAQSSDFTSIAESSALTKH